MENKIITRIKEYSLIIMISVIFILLMQRVITGFWLFDTSRAPVTKVEPLTNEQFEPLYQMKIVYKSQSITTSGTLRELQIEKCQIEKQIRYDVDKKALRDSIIESQLKILEQINCK